MKIYQAPDTSDSLATVARLRRDAQRWLAATGTDQWANDWPDTETMLAGFARRMRNGETWFASDADGLRRRELRFESSSGTESDDHSR